MPNVKELASPFDASETEPFLNRNFFPNTPEWHWTSISTDAGSRINADEMDDDGVLLETLVESAFSGVETRFIYWDATKRIEHQPENIVEQCNSHLDAGRCRSGCLLFTHSTGGLVGDTILSRSYESREHPMIFPNLG